MRPLAHPVAEVNGEAVAYLSVTAHLSTPWRTLIAEGRAEAGSIGAAAGYLTTSKAEVFAGAVDDARQRALGDGRLVARSLPSLRRTIGPQGFQDAALETILTWIADRTGITLVLGVSGPVRRHYLLPKTSAWQAMQSALQAWRLEYVAIELDDGRLYIGPEGASPHATLPPQERFTLRENVFELRLRRHGLARIVTPAYPWLRVGHRVEVEHPLMHGTARIIEYTHTYAIKDTTSTLEVALT
jgi:hypothetical protein